MFNHVSEYNLLYLTSGFSANRKSISCIYHFSFFFERTDTDSACFYSRIQYAVSKPTFRSDLLLPPFQFIGCFGFSRYTTFIMYLDISFILVHSKSYVPRKAETTYNLKQRAVVVNLI